MSKLIHVAFFVIPIGIFFRYDRCQVIGISIEKDAPVTALESEIQKYHLDEKFRNASFSLCAIDCETKIYRDIKSKDKISGLKILLYLISIFTFLWYLPWMRKIRHKNL